MTSEISVPIKTEEGIVQIVIKDALCGCCLDTAVTIGWNVPICRRCFEWLGVNTPDGIVTKRGCIRTQNMLFEHLKNLRNDIVTSEFDPK